MTWRLSPALRDRLHRAPVGRGKKEFVSQISERSISICHFANGRRIVPILTFTLSVLIWTVSGYVARFVAVVTAWVVWRLATITSDVAGT